MWPCGVVFFFFIQQAYTLSPKQLKARGEAQASTMVDIAREVKKTEFDIPTIEQLKDEKQTSALKMLHETLRKSSDLEQGVIQGDRESPVTCTLPSYERDYSLRTLPCQPNAFCQGVFDQRAQRGFSNRNGPKVGGDNVNILDGVIELLGSCYFAVPLEHHGLSLVDFRPMTLVDKKNWEKENCLFFPKKKTTEIYYKDHKRPSLPNRSQAQQGVVTKSNPKLYALPLTHVHLTLEGPVSQQTGEIIS